MSHNSPDELPAVVRDMLGMEKVVDPKKEARQAALKEEFDNLKAAYELKQETR